MRFRNLRKVAVVVGAPVIAAMNCSSLAAEETAGQKFRAVLGNLEKWCKDNKVGPYLDRNDPEYRRKVGATDCDLLRLEPRDWREVKMVKLDSQPYPVPEHWLATPEGRFAHSIKLPTPHEQRKNVYREGMSAGEYFQALCRSEAGDFVFKAVEDVDGIARMRRPEIGTDTISRHLYATEGTLGMSLWHLLSERDDSGDVLVQPPHGRYHFVEVRSLPRSESQDGFAFRRLMRDPNRAVGTSVKYLPEGGTRIVRNEVIEEGIPKPSARYGFTWRGVVRPNDRELGISGAELIVLDLARREVLGVRRAFRLTAVGRSGSWWLSASNCSPQLATLPTKFLYDVLRPTR